MKDLDARAELSQAPRLENLVGCEGLGFLGEEVQVREPGTVINKGDVVTLLSLRLDRSWPPEVGVDLISESLTSLPCTCLRNGLPSGLRVHTGFAKEIPQRSLLDVDTGDKPFVNKTLGNLR